MNNKLNSPCTEEIKKILEKHGHTNVQTWYDKNDSDEGSTCCGGKFKVKSDQTDEQEVGETLGQSIVNIGKFLGKL